MTVIVYNFEPQNLGTNFRCFLLSLNNLCRLFKPSFMIKVNFELRIAITYT